MWFDETPRLLSVAEILKKKKNKEDNYDRDDIPDVKKQELTGKYDTNFDALGSDFERAHNYNLNNIQQPENTKDDVEYSDKYNNFFKYEPSSYVKLEEDEYKPFSKYDEKANEYYIDNLQGKTLDDLIISKMKENAGAEDLPRDAMRRQFTEEIVRGRTERVHTGAGLNITEDNNLAPVLQELQQQKKQHKVNKNTVKAVGMKNVIIEPPLSTSSALTERRSDRLQGVSAPAMPFSPEKTKRGGRQNKLFSSSSSPAPHSDKNEQQAILNSLQDVKSQSKKEKSTTVGNVLGSKQLSQDYLDSLDDHLGGGGAVQKYEVHQPSDGKDKKGKDKDKDKKDEKDENKGGGKPLSKEEAREERARQAQARLEHQEEERIKQLDVQNRVKEYQTLIPKLKAYTSDKQLDKEDWATYRALMKFHKIATGNIPKASTAVKNLQERLAESIKSSENTVKQTKLQQIQEDQTLAGNKLNFSSDLKSVKSHPKTPVGKVQANESRRPRSPSETNREAIEGMLSHNNPSTTTK